MRQNTASDLGLHCSAKHQHDTIKLLKIQTPEKIAEIILKFELYAFTVE